MTKKIHIPWSPTSIMHMIKLVVRSLFFLTALSIYIFDRITGGFEFLNNQFFSTFIMGGILLIYLIEMLLRFLPNSIESMGCQKIYKKNYIKPNNPTNLTIPNKSSGALLVLISWVALNLIFGVLYWTNVIDEGILILISLTYGICDMICILFFCPFQTWMMKNKCCNTCRVYNWDFFMIFTPLIFIRHWATYSLVIISLLLVVIWESGYWRYKERFYEETNASLRCENCREKLCSHKKQLQRLAIKLKQEAQRKIQKTK